MNIDIAANPNWSALGMDRIRRWTLRFLSFFSCFHKQMWIWWDATAMIRLLISQLWAHQKRDYLGIPDLPKEALSRAWVFLRKERNLGGDHMAGNWEGPEAAQSSPGHKSARSRDLTPTTVRKVRRGPPEKKQSKMITVRTM